MTGRFLAGFFLAFVLVAAMFTGLGFATSALLFQPPPERYYARGLSFEYPPGWRCRTEGAETVCAPPGPKTRSILILAAQTVNVYDTLDTYRRMLSAPMSHDKRNWRRTQAKVLSVEDRTLGGQVWIDGTQQGSEIGVYNTRYLATVAGATAVLMTLSCHKDNCDALRPLIDAVAASLQVTGSTIYGPAG